MKSLSFICMFLALSTAFGQLPSKIGLFDEQSDVGNPAIKGDVFYNSDTQEYTLSGASINMWGKTDQHNFLWKKIKGDFIISATVKFIGAGTDPHRKIGIIARNSLDPNSAYADAAVHGDVLTSLQSRETVDAETKQLELSIFHPSHIEFQRKGNKFFFSAATQGESFKTVTKEISLNQEVFAGLFLCSHNEKVVEKAIFSNVRITFPAADDFKPYKDYLGSQIEILDIKTGLRKIIHSVPISIQAPNWSKDGKYLYYNNSDGKMLKFTLATGKEEILNTGNAVANNNDHVLSFDGKMIGLSSYLGDPRRSTIYTLALDGKGEAKQITDPSWGHSWFHCWSPDGKRMIYMGDRNKQQDIWAIDIATKKETQLTKTPTLDDGPEYTPDGKYIYFNSVRTGTMKIYRMKPDGSNQEQVTFDEYNDWFPHISPDGKQLIYIAFPKDIDPTSHPFYKKVSLKIMPVSGGIPQTIAYFYGGQGSINTPSWSPDGRYVAFISNTKL